MNELSDLKKRDAALVWHPYSQHQRSPDFIPVQSAKGAYLTLAAPHEKPVIDAISSWWVNIHGHGHPAISDAIYQQSQKLDHVIFAGFTHEPAVALAEHLIEAANKAHSSAARVFYSDNGSTAVEVALKMAFQYFTNQNIPGKTRFIALRGSYHGDTLGTMAVGEPEGFHSVFKPLFAQVDFVQPGDLETLKDLLEKRGHEYCAFIFEPLLQGASGMQMYSPHFLREAAELCKKHQVITIADEVFTGFYRTAKMFAFEHAGIDPDLICLSKGITGGTLPLAVTLASDKIYESFLSPDLRKAFLHGHSYTANPIACAAALASWKLLQSQPCQQRIVDISQLTQRLLGELSDSPRLNHKIKAVRSLGTIGAVEIKTSSNYFTVDSAKITRFALDRGVLIRPLGNVLYSVPPYCITDDELVKIYHVMGEIIDELY